MGRPGSWEEEQAHLRTPDCLDPDHGNEALEAEWRREDEVRFYQPGLEPVDVDEELDSEWVREGKSRWCDVDCACSSFAEEHPEFLLPDGSKYTGQWLRGKPNGHGLQVWLDGRSYRGEFRDGQAHGLGSFSYADGSVYTGAWSNNTANGMGECRLADKTVYQGEWLDGKQHGQGSLTFPDGTEYHGQFANGSRSGEGTVAYAGRSAGCSYQGQFERDVIHGAGTYVWADGRRYQGQWKDNQISGKGQYSCIEKPQCRASQFPEDTKSWISADTKSGASTCDWPVVCGREGAIRERREDNTESDSDSEGWSL